MRTDDMIMVPVDSEEHLYMLREYRKVLQSTMGPNGSCKALLTEGDYLEVTSAGTTLTARLELSSPVCKYVNNISAGLADHSLYCGVLLSHLLEQQWQECTLSKAKIMHIISILVEELKTFILSEKVCVTLDFDSVTNFLPLVQTIITSKCSVLLSGMDVKKLCIEIVKVFLTCIDEETSVINRIYVKVESGSNSFTSYKGLLYSVSDSHSTEIVRDLSGDVNILVFTQKLEDSDELFSFDNVKPILEYAVQSGVKVIACQRTVASEIKLFLRRRKIILLERMGTDLTKMLINISGAFPISQLNFTKPEIVKLTGKLSLIEHVRFSERDYLVLINKNVPVGTLLVQTSTLLGEDFIKVLIQQALAALRSIVVHPLLTIAGGCLETCIIGQIYLLKENRKEKEFGLVSRWALRAFLSVCCAVEMDTLYHHAWREGRTCCNCGLVRREEVEQGSGSWLILHEVVNSEVSLQASLQPNMTLCPDVLVESQQQKLHVICIVFEAFANLGNVGLILHKS